MQWVFGKKFKPQEVLTERFICDLHKRMYRHVWKWAGEFTKTNKNSGSDRHQISTELKVLCDDAMYWMTHQTFPPEAIAIRFKHRLVTIHCFADGNGRHSRLMGDIIIEKLFGQPVFSWGANDLSKAGEARTAYLTAVKAADRGDYAPLLRFCRS